ncbi:MAG TPA: hypothetical protein VD861_19085 [Pyrinomonadaceae bacterium]|nr:hypothetical protein [Pyrinomonadaceae bacterium]
MSKIDEVKSAYENYRREKKVYADTCRAFVTDLKGAFAEYLGCTVGEVKFFKPSMVTATQTLKTFINVKPEHALELKKDGYWRFGVAYAVPEVGDFLYVVRLKYEDGIYSLGLDDDDFHVHSGSREELTPFFDHMISVTTGYYETYQEDLLAGNQPESVFELVKPKPKQGG